MVQLYPPLIADTMFPRIHTATPSRPASSPAPSSSNAQLIHSIRLLARQLFDIDSLQETVVDACLSWRKEASRDLFYTSWHSVISTSRGTLTLISDHDKTGFVVTGLPLTLRSCVREPLQYYISCAEEPYYTLVQQLTTLRSQTIPLSKLQELARIERIYMNHMTPGALPLPLAHYLEDRTRVEVSRVPNSSISRNLLEAAYSAMEKLAAMHAAGWLWNASEPLSALRYHSNRLILSFENSVPLSKYSRRAEEGNLSALFLQHLYKHPNFETRRDEAIKASDASRLAFALLGQLCSSLDPFFDSVTTLFAGLDSDGNAVYHKTNFPLYSAYNSDTILRANLDELTHLATEEITLIGKLLSHFLPRPTHYSSSLPPEVAYALSLFKASTLNYRIFSDHSHPKRIVSYHVLPDGIYGCTQKEIASGGFMGLWRQCCYRLPYEGAAQACITNYHLISRNEQREDVRLVYKIHKAIASLGLAGIHPPGTLIQQAAVPTPKQTTAEHFQTFTPHLRHAILVDYVPAGSCYNNPTWEAFSARKKETLLTALAETVSNLHSCLILHRDIKPDNILLTDDGLKLTDFGLSGTWSKVVHRDRKIPLVKGTNSGTPSYKFACAYQRLSEGPLLEKYSEIGTDLDWEAFSLTELELLFGKYVLNRWFNSTPYISNGRERHTWSGANETFLPELQKALSNSGYSESYKQAVLARARKLPRHTSADF